MKVIEFNNLESYKLQHQFTTSLELQSADTGMQGMKPFGDGEKDEDELEWLSKIIKVLNNTYGLDLKEEYKIEFKKMKKSIYANEEFYSKLSEDKVNLMFKQLWFNDLYDQKVRGISK